jgi:hypothetical protein
MMMTANKGLGDVFACAILDNKRFIVRNVVDETDFPVYTFLDKDMRRSKCESFRMNIGSVF